MSCKVWAISLLLALGIQSALASVCDSALTGIATSDEMRKLTPEGEAFVKLFQFFLDRELRPDVRQSGYSVVSNSEVWANPFLNSDQRPLTIQLRSAFYELEERTSLIQRQRDWPEIQSRVAVIWRLRQEHSLDHQKQSEVTRSVFSPIGIGDIPTRLENSAFEHTGFEWFKTKQGKVFFCYGNKRTNGLSIEILDKGVRQSVTADIVGRSVGNYNFAWHETRQGEVFLAVNDDFVTSKFLKWDGRAFRRVDLGLDIRSVRWLQTADGQTYAIGKEENSPNSALYTFESEKLSKVADLGYFAEERWVDWLMSRSGRVFIASRINALRVDLLELVGDQLNLLAELSVGDGRISLHESLDGQMYLTSSRKAENSNKKGKGGNFLDVFKIVDLKRPELLSSHRDLIGQIHWTNSEDGSTLLRLSGQAGVDILEVGSSGVKSILHLDPKLFATLGTFSTFFEYPYSPVGFASGTKKGLYIYKFIGGNMFETAKLDVRARFGDDLRAPPKFLVDGDQMYMAIEVGGRLILMAVYQ